MTPTQKFPALLDDLVKGEVVPTTPRPDAGVKVRLAHKEVDVVLQGENQ